MSRMIAWSAAIVALICCAGVEAAPSVPPTPASHVKPAAPAETPPPKPVDVNVVSLPPAAPTTVQSSTPVVVRVDNWNEQREDSSGRWVAVFTLVLAVATFLLWRSTKALADEGRNTATRQLRAYVFPVQFEILADRPNKVRVTAKNFGKTPAYNIAMAARFELAASEDHLTPVNDAGPSLGILAPESVTSVKAEEVQSQESAAGQNSRTPNSGNRNTFEQYAHGLISYRDTFGKRRWSRFRQVYRGGGFVACSSGNDADDSADFDQK